ncbi:uncharacterized protein DUF3343 [Anaerobacterium chartisolvens]|uniref:Uncharacterized protein DUF3343 n=1 Tax=Anaerobacterium chartisolvens TaxID=1297424 RepID=A0A369AU54_9FIRM|nr:putative Se/S carrier-like protein [Anaerobacterium chartisolvens]RCX12553.1 uncharacterized protein DUF3343 [Anaerobacterium chartisolvens]
MSQDEYLIIARNTGQMLLVDKLMRDNLIKAEIVPAPPRPGMACTKAVKISGGDLCRAEEILAAMSVNVNEILKSEGLKLQSILDAKAGEANDIS